ncbi:hypothetical protein PtB15_7B716 [Puccinia triticina]|nr:hypothetical protein PtB15_7B716 [Puccinia triticina]
MDDSLHHRANFPSNLAISCKRRPGREDLCAEQNHFGDDLAAFGIAAKTWDASFALLNYLLLPRNTDCLRRRPRMEKLKLVLGTITVQQDLSALDHPPSLNDSPGSPINHLEIAQYGPDLAAADTTAFLDREAALSI